MKIMITGSNGFVGSRLMWDLEKNGHKVYGIDNRDQCNIKKHPRTRLGDIRIIEDLNNFSDKKIDIVIHCAASKHDFGVTKEEYFSNNQLGTRVLMNFLHKEKIKKVIYFSTVSVYGYRGFPCDESAEVKPNHPYGGSKYGGEKEIVEWMKKNEDSQVIFLRPAMIYGPHNYANMYNLINYLHKNPYFMLGKGEHVKGIISLSNLIDMTLWALKNLKEGINIYNCTDQPYITLDKLIKTITEIDGFKKPILRIPEKFAFFIGSIFDWLGKLLKKDFPVNSDRIRKINTSTFFYSEKIRNEGYKQKFSIEEEVRKTCHWYLDTQNQKKHNE